MAGAADGKWQMARTSLRTIPVSWQLSARFLHRRCGAFRRVGAAAARADQPAGDVVAQQSGRVLRGARRLSGSPGPRPPADRPGTLERGSPSDADARADFGRSAQRRLAPILHVPRSASRRVGRRADGGDGRAVRVDTGGDGGRQGNKETRKQGNKETSRQGHRAGTPLLPCLLVYSSTCFLNPTIRRARGANWLNWTPLSGGRWPAGTGGLRHRRGGERQDSPAGSNSPAGRW